MRILLIMDPFIRVPPAEYGGIERVVADLANGLARRGHSVTLWAAPGSGTSATLEPFGHEGEWTRWSNVRNATVLSVRLVQQRQRFDVIHNFGRLAYLISVLRRDVPKVQTYMRPVNPGNMRKVRALGGRRVRFTAVSAAIRDTGLPGGGEWSVVYNCAPLDEFTPRFDVDPRAAPLLFLGRLERCKGAHTAIAVARRLRRPLVIAGNRSTLPHEKIYFEQEIAPQIDGALVRYVGPVDNARKNTLISQAAALLLPVEWDEPFPVVLPEALLCGTPVIGFRRGGIPEGIADGRTGFVCDDAAGMAEAIGRLPSIDRAACRAEAERRFSDETIVTAYETVYRSLMEP